ncbi:MAG: hypothetical protein QGH60_14810 [Phycisphaerae bacterium]|jgi:hypothetical protein|nr:hypothetical protein [Phycisphaerae bacterium]
MLDESDITSTPCDVPSIEHARIKLAETLQRCGMWTDQCDQEAGAYVKAMVQAGLDEEAVSRELRGLGVPASGAVKLIREAEIARELSEAETDPDEPVDRSGLRLLWGILCLFWLLLAGIGTMSMTSGVLSRDCHGAIATGLVVGAIGCSLIWIRVKLLNDG